MQGRRKRGVQEQRVNRVRYAILGLAAVLVALVAGYGLLYSSGATEPGEIAEGTHYRLIEDPLRRRPGDPVVVTEFFSYGCIHCRNLQPFVEDWRSDLPEDVRFERAPVSFNAAQALQAQTYFALEAAGGLEANHERIFRAIHDNGRQFLSVDDVADFVAGRGVGRQAFLDAVNSSDVRRRQAGANALSRRFQIAATPTLVVAGRYAVTMDAGRRQALETVDRLIERERGASGS